MQHDGGQVPTFVDYGFSGFPEILPIVKGKKVPPAEIVFPRNKEACLHKLLSDLSGQGGLYETRHQ